MVIDECIDRLEEYGYVVSISPWPGRLYIDGYGLRIGLTVNEGIVTEIDCYLRREDEIDLLLGTTSVYPEYRGVTEMVDGIGMSCDDYQFTAGNPGVSWSCSSVSAVFSS